MHRLWLRASLTPALAAVAGAWVMQASWSGAMVRSFVRGPAAILFASEVPAGWLGLSVTVGLVLGLRPGRRALPMRWSRRDVPLLVGTLCALTLVAASWHLLNTVVLDRDAEATRALALTGPLFAAISEETVFRLGLLWSVARHGRTQALLASAVAFALAHVPVFGAGALSVHLPAGLIYGALLLRTRSLPGVVGVHVAYDVIAMWLDATAQGTPALHRGLALAALASSSVGLLAYHRRLLAELRRPVRALVRCMLSPRRVWVALASGAAVGAASVVSIRVTAPWVLFATTAALALALALLFRQGARPRTT